MPIQRLPNKREGQPLKRFNELLRILTIVVPMAICISGSSLAQQPTLNVMPLPAHVQQGSGSMAIDNKFSASLTGFVEPRLELSLQRFRKQLARETGLVFLKPTAGGNKSEVPATLVIHTGHASQPVQELGED